MATSEFGRRVVLHEYAHSVLHRGARKPDVAERGAPGFLLDLRAEPEDRSRHSGRVHSLERIITAKNTDALWEDGARVALEHFRWVRDEGAKEEIDYGIAIEELIRFEMPERKS